MIVLPVPAFAMILLNNLPTGPNLICKPNAALLKAADDQLLARAENLERQGNFAEAEKYYRRFVELEEQLHQKVDGSGIIARILDRQGLHLEADKYYSAFESNAASYEQHKIDLKQGGAQKKLDFTPPPLGNRLSNGGTVIADGRLLRIMQTIPPEKYRLAGDKRLFDYIMAETNRPAGDLGRRISIADLRPYIWDYRRNKNIVNTAHDQSQVHSKSAENKQSSESASLVKNNTKDQKLPKGQDADIKQVETAGTVLEGNTVRTYIAKIGKEKAKKEFEFIEKFERDTQNKIPPEEFSDTPLPGYAGVASPRDLIPRQIIILDQDTAAKLKRMAGY